MLGRRIKLYRLKYGWSKKELAEKLGISLTMLSSFETDKKTPDGQTIQSLASAFGITLPQFLSLIQSNVKYRHGSFRKQTSLSKSAQSYLHMLSEDSLNKFFLLEELLGSDVLREPPALHSLIVSGSPEADALRLRELLGFRQSGAVSNLIDVLENKGILICKIHYKGTNFSGINGMADRYPYIAFNSETTPERQRSTIVHELVHVFFEPPEHEKYIEAVCGAFLFPAADAYIELGRKRRTISPDMVIVAREYGISLQLLAKRANQLEIITTDAYRSFNIAINKAKVKISEGYRIAPEEPKLLEQLVLRALDEDKISMSRAAELLDIPYHIVREKAALWN